MSDIVYVLGPISPAMDAAEQLLRAAGAQVGYAVRQDYQRIRPGDETAGIAYEHAVRFIALGADKSETHWEPVVAVGCTVPPGWAAKAEWSDPGLLGRTISALLTEHPAFVRLLGEGVAHLMT